MILLPMATDILEGLNPRQREAVLTVGGPLLIVAGPGSGKTRVITHRIAYLVRECGVQPWRIAALTFTNKAAREMRERLSGLMRYSADDLFAGTFHSFCAMLLRRDGAAVGLGRDFVIYDDSDQIALIKTVMEEVKVDAKRFGPRAIQSRISSAKSRLITPEGFAHGVGDYFDEVALRVYERYDELLRQASAVDFDDLLLKAFQLLRVPEVAERYRERYVHLLIDEFQDTNIAQYEIAKALAGEYRNLCVVGDPDQSIYSWRNADIGNILSFVNDFPKAKTISLEENYRSTRTILEAADGLIAANTERVEKGLWTSNDRGAPIVVEEGYDPREEAQIVLREIDALVEGEGYSHGEIAVMYRVNSQSRALEDAFLRGGVRYQVVGGPRFYQRQEVKDIVAYLRLLVNPDDDVSLARVVNLPPRGIGRRTLDRLHWLARDTGVSLLSAVEAAGGGSSIAPRQSRALSGFRSLIVEMAGEVGRLGLVGLIDLVLERTGYAEHLRRDPDEGEGRLENVQELRAAAREYETLGERESVTAFLENVSLVSDVDSYEEQNELVTLITLHQAKGLEFPVVFIVGMEEGLLPHIRSMDDPAQMEEERRLCYVGVTRAKSRLYLLRAFRRGFGGSFGPSLPSRFLEEIPRRLMMSPARPEPGPEWGSARRGSPLSLRTGEEAGKRTGPTGAGREAGRGDALPSRTSAGRRAALAAAGREAKPAAPAMKAGDKVRHDKFGEGMVVSCTPSGGDFEVTVAFKEGQGVKRLLLSFAPLRRLP